jgi:hypothetical protein
MSVAQEKFTVLMKVNLAALSWPSISQLIKEVREGIEACSLLPE